MKREYTFFNHRGEVAIKAMPDAVRIQSVAVLPKDTLRIASNANGKRKAAAEMRFCMPVPMFCLLLIFVFRSVVLLLYTAIWNMMK